MSKIENLKYEILDLYTQKQAFDERYHRKLLKFLKESKDLVILSNGLYQIEHTIRLNKISLKDYVLNSETCKILKKFNVQNYSIAELKQYLNRFEAQKITNVESYLLALEQYETLEDMEILEDNKVNYELGKLKIILCNIHLLETIDKENYQEIYNSFIKQIKEQYLDNGYIDKQIYNCLIQVLNDIFYYYLYGYREIPMEETF